MEITASLVKELRERTGAGMMECKKALTENNGDIDVSAEWLRKQGLAKADKKADRVAAEGRIAVAQAGGKAVLVDSRPAPFFQGRIANDAAKARGTLPGAINIDSDLYFELGSAVLLDKASLQTEADAAHAAPGQEVVTFCNAGHWSAPDWFVRSEILGEKNVKLYPGSVVDWSQAPEPLPMANEPGRWDKLRDMLTTWADRNPHLIKTR
mgnify:CR=1 FL=1